VKLEGCWDFDRPGDVPTVIAGSTGPRPTKTAVTSVTSDGRTTGTKGIDTFKQYWLTLVLLICGIALMGTARVSETVQIFDLGLQSQRFASSLGMLSIICSVVSFIMEGALGFEPQASTVPKPSTRSLSDVCEDVRSAASRHRLKHSEPYPSVVEATHRCCRLQSLVDKAHETDPEVVETLARITTRLPELLRVYDAMDGLATPEESWTRLDLFTDAVIALGEEAEGARKRMLSRATDALDAQSRFMRAGREMATPYALTPIEATAPTSHDLTKTEHSL
jgi:hypothetical protein